MDKAKAMIAVMVVKLSQYHYHAGSLFYLVISRILSVVVLGVRS